MKALIVVADAARARLFKTEEKITDISELDELSHPESRLRDRELGSGTPVKSANQKGSLQPRTSPKDYEEQSFAKELGKHIKSLHNDLHFEELILIASPRFLGMLRNELDSTLDKLVSKSINKELLQADVDSIIEYIKNY
jgi:protein required for attachment to host cells